MTIEGDETARWQSASSDDIVWASCGDGYVAYHRPSGKTHFLNASTHRLITEFLSVPAAAAAVATAFDLGEDDPRREEIAGLLGHLEELGLIDRV